MRVFTYEAHFPCNVFARSTSRPVNIISWNGTRSFSMTIKLVHFWEEIPLSDLPMIIMIMFEALFFGCCMAAVIFGFPVFLYWLGRLVIRIYNVSLQAALSMDCPTFLPSLEFFNKVLALGYFKPPPKPFDIRAALSNSKGLTNSGNALIDRVFNIPEVAELILDEIHIWQLLRLQTVNKVFLRLIRESPLLKERFFWAPIESKPIIAKPPVPGTPLRLSPLLDWFATAGFVGNHWLADRSVEGPDAPRMVFHFLPHTLRILDRGTLGLRQLMLTDPPTFSVFLAVPEPRKNGHCQSDLSSHKQSADCGDGVLDISISRPTGVTWADVLFAWKTSKLVSNKAACVGLWFAGPDFASRLRNRAECHATLADQYYVDVHNASVAQSDGSWLSMGARLTIRDSKRWMTVTKKEQDQKMLELLKARMLDGQQSHNGTVDAVEWQIMAGKNSGFRVAVFNTMCRPEDGRVDYANGLDCAKLRDQTPVSEDFHFD